MLTSGAVILPVNTVVADRLYTKKTQLPEFISGTYRESEFTVTNHRSISKLNQKNEEILKTAAKTRTFRHAQTRLINIISRFLQETNSYKPDWRSSIRLECPLDSTVGTARLCLSSSGCNRRIFLHRILPEKIGLKPEPL